MARTPKKNGAARAGDNSQAEAELLVHHMTKLRAKKVAVDEAKAELSAVQDEMTELFRIAKVDGFTRKELTSYLADSSARLRNLLEEEKRRFRHRVALGLPVFGEQQDLFGGAETPEEAKDELFWEAEGYLNGRRGAPAEIPQDCPVRFHTHFMKGDARGQAENGELLKAGAKRAAVAPKGKLTGGEDPDKKPDEDDADPAALDAKAKALKQAGWTEPTKEEAAFA